MTDFEMAFYTTMAQVIPVIFIALAFEAKAFALTDTWSGDSRHSRMLSLVLNLSGVMLLFWAEWLCVQGILSDDGHASRMATIAGMVVLSGTNLAALIADGLAIRMLTPEEVRVRYVMRLGILAFGTIAAIVVVIRMS